MQGKRTNFRTSILAAANPVKGRYDRSRTLQANLNIGAPIMSRFDLFYVVVDERDDILDDQIAKHIVTMHQQKDRVIKPYFNQKELLTYLKYCRQIKPKFTKKAGEKLANEFVRLRQNDVTKKNQSYRITIRQLESII